MGSMSADVLLRSFFVVPRDVAGRDVIGGVFRCVARRRRANVAGLDVICGVSYIVPRVFVVRYFPFVVPRDVAGCDVIGGISSCPGPSQQQARRHSLSS